MKCLCVEGTARATSTPSDALVRAQPVVSPRPQQAQSNLTKYSRSQSALLVPHLHPSSELPSCCVPTITSRGDHAPPILSPPDMPTSFDFTKHCQQWTLNPQKPFNLCSHPLTKGSVLGPNKKPIPVSASQAPWDGHKTQQSPLGTTSTSRVTFPFPERMPPSGDGGGSSLPLPEGKSGVSGRERPFPWEILMPRPASIPSLQFFRCQWLLRRMVTQRPKQTNKQTSSPLCTGVILEMFLIY